MSSSSAGEATPVETPEEFQAGVKSAREYLTRPLRLYEIRLPAGLHGAINIGWFPNGAERVLDPKSWLSQGYDGVRIVGAGVDKTVLRDTSWGGITVAATRHPGVVQLEGMTIYCGSNAAVVMGEQNHEKEIVPGFALRLINSKIVAPPPDQLAFGRAKWGVFYYQCDVTYINVEIDVYHASEHGTYGHGFSKMGAYVRRLHQRASGAEGWKVRPDVTETAWLRETPWIVIEDSVFKNWFQPWSARGGGGLVLQNACAHVSVDRSIFIGGGRAGSVESNMRSKAIMISSELDGYDVDTGEPIAVSHGAGTGLVRLSKNLLYGYSDVDWHNTLVRCAPNASGTLSAKGFWLERSGLYGKNMIVQAGGLPPRRAIVNGCNSDEIREAAEARSIDTAFEATIPLSDRRIKVSEGWTR